MGNVMAIAGDICSKNRGMSQTIGLTFVGCHSHLYKVSVQAATSENKSSFSAVLRLMNKLHSHIPAANLRQFTPLKENHENETRWSSTFHMLKRYI